MAEPTRKMTPKEERFIREYQLCQNATQAAIKAGYSAKTAGQAGSRLLKKVEISTPIQQNHVETLANLDISVQRVLKERARLAFFDPRKLLDNTGRPLPIQDLDDDTAAALAGLKVKDVYDKPADGKGPGVMSTILEYKLADKNASLTALEKHLGMYAPEEKGDGVLNIVINLF